MAYLHGSPRFVTETMKALMKGRLFPRDIYSEGFTGWVVASVRTSIGAGRHGRGGERRVPPVLNKRPRYTTVTVATRSSRRGGSVRTMS